MSAANPAFSPAQVIHAVTAPRAHLDIWSHGVRISKFGGEIRAMMIDLCRTEWAEYSMVKTGRFSFQKKISKVYIGTNTQRTWFHFHRNQLDFVLAKLAKNGVPTDKITVTRHEMYEPTKVEHPLVDDRPPREAQLPILEYLAQPCDPNYAPSKVVTIQTGKGKTFVGLADIRREGVRAAIVLKGMYIAKWIEDVEAAYGSEKGSLMVVRGIPHLLNAVAQARAGTLKARVIIISNKTMNMYLKYYQDYGVDDYIDFAPMDLYKILGVGVRLIDEVHQEFHCNYRQDIYCHVPKTISLSATLEPDSKVTEKMYYIVWPVGTWAPEMEYHKYIAVTNLWFSFKEIGKVRWLNFMRQYNHTELEKSIMRDRQMLKNYIEMLTYVTEEIYVKKREPGQKMFLFVATVALATMLAEHLAIKFPELIINRYVSEDEYGNLQGADISVTTLLSAGTAVDVPNLRVTLMTTALSTKQGNLQVLGRTRPLIGWPDVTPDFYFLSARNIDKHVQYAKEKKEKFRGKVVSFIERQIERLI